MSLLQLSNFPPVLSPVGGHCRGCCRRDIGTEPGRQMLALAGGHRGSEGQGKRRIDPGAALQCIPKCSSGLPLVVLKLYPELHPGIPPGRL
ncbi:unnamed protein product, partial [Staurois parvus]